MQSGINQQGLDGRVDPIPFKPVDDARELSAQSSLAMIQLDERIMLLEVQEE